MPELGSEKSSPFFYDYAMDGLRPSKKSVDRHRDRSTPVVEDIRHRLLLTIVDERSQIGLILRGIQL